ncbi:DUF6776 family protein [Planctobacterium marinum]|uniref:DUF6776 family protein n=1 Tax=Planctobacterium marinum TaxID=1631968 RepID=UPI001E355ABD|nr:DUF6776 family protein [Planctobacterium marinum]
MQLNHLKARLGAFRFYLALIAVMFFSGWLGYTWSGLKHEQQQEEIQTLNQSINNLVTENDRLTRDINILGVDLEVARLAAEENRKRFQQQMSTENELRRELSFYQKVMAPELEQDGFVIDSFNVEPTASDGFFRYAMILMQQDRHRTTVKGRVKISLVGSHAGKPSEIQLTDSMTENSDDMEFSFRYFEVLKGEFSIPDDFAPELIVVESYLKDKKWGSDYLKRTFEWQLNESAISE